MAHVTADDYSDFVSSLFKKMGDRDNLAHAAMGIAGEAGELLDAIKKHWAYGKPLDIENVIEELGDLEFYMQALRIQIGVPRSFIIDKNVAKLSKRYSSGKYSDQQAQERADKIHQEETFSPQPKMVRCTNCNSMNESRTTCWACGELI
jgi:NTP pyrophosphatase (non-canonical NTP hydrolase)